MELKVGDKLWYVSSRFQNRSTQLDVTVTKVGRKWVYIDYRDYRIDPKTLEVDGNGYTSPGKCYPSKEIYDEFSLANRLYSELYRKMQYGTLRLGVTSKNIIEAAKILGFELKIERSNNDGKND